MNSYVKRLIGRPGYYTMRTLGRFHGIRRVLPALVGPKNLRPPMATESLFPELDTAGTVENLKQDGIALGITLPDDILAEILEFTRTTPCYGNACADYGFYYPELENAQARTNTRFVKARYFNSNSCNAISRIARDPKLWDIAENYLGAVPRHIGNNLWWNFPGKRTLSEQNKYAQLFHYDLDDYRFMKFFFYLTDVDEEAGPHVFVRGSHVEKPMWWQLKCQRITDASVSARYGDDKVTPLMGKAGIGFAEDTYGIHKGVTPTTTARLILQFEFALFDYDLANDDREPQSLRMAA